MESKFRQWRCVLYMVRKCFCDGNDGDNDNGDGDDGNICLYKILKRIMI